MLLAEEAILVDESARRDTMHMSSRCLSSKSMNSSKCDGQLGSNLNMLSQAMEWVVADRLLGKACMMTFRNLTLAAEVEVEAGWEAAVDSKLGVEVREDQRHHKLVPKVLHQQMHRLDQRMLVSQVQTIEEEVEAVSEDFIHTREDDLRKDLVP